MNRRLNPPRGQIMHTEPVKTFTKEGAAVLCLFAFIFGIGTGGWLHKSDLEGHIENNRSLYHNGVGYRCVPLIETPAMGIGK